MSEKGWCVCALSAERPSFQIGYLLRSDGVSSVLQRLFQTPHQLVEVDWLAEKGKSAAVHRSRPRSFVAIGRHENHWRLGCILRIQHRLQFDAAQARHFDIHEHAIDRRAIIIGEESFRRAKQSAPVAA